MSKEYLEAFSRITLHTDFDNDGSYNCLQFEDDCKLVENALQEFDDIKNAKPSEAMKIINKMLYGIEEFEFVNLEMVLTRDLEKVKQALLKAQEQEKVLNIIKEKNVDLDEIRANATVKGYNSNIPYYRQSLIDEEFRLVKEWMRYE